MSIPVAAVPLIKAAAELVLFGTLAEIATVALPIVVGGAVIAGAAYYLFSKNQAEELRQKAIKKYIESNVGSPLYPEIRISGYKWKYSDTTGYPESKGRFTEFIAYTNRKFSIITRPHRYGDDLYDFDWIIRDDEPRDYFYYQELGTNYYYLSNDFYPGSISFKYSEPTSWDDLPANDKRRIINSLNDDDWNSAIQSSPAAGYLQPGNTLIRPIITGDLNAENPNLRQPQQSPETIKIPQPIRLPARTPEQLKSPVPQTPPRDFIPTTTPVPTTTPAPVTPAPITPTPTPVRDTPRKRAFPPPIPLPQKDPIVAPIPRPTPQPEPDPKPETPTNPPPTQTDICEAPCIAEILDLVRQIPDTNIVECEKFSWLEIQVPVVYCEFIQNEWKPRREYTKVSAIATESGSDLLRTLLQFEEMAKQAEMACLMRQKLEVIDKRIQQIGANTINVTRSLISGVVNIDEYIAESLGKLANALKKVGVVSPTAYPWFSEQINGSITQLERIKNQDAGASGLNIILAEVANITQLANELSAQKTSFETALQTSPPKERSDNQPIKSQADSSTINSIGPEINEADKEVDE